MAVSFLSTISTVLPLAPFPYPNSPSSSSSRVLTHAGSIRCDIRQTRVSDEDRLHRRDILKCFGATISMEVLAGSGLLVEMASAADLIQLRQRSEFLSNVKATLSTTIKANPELIPSIMTLALNDAVTYDKGTKSGGPNGSVRFSSEISRPENKGLSASLNILEEAKKSIDSNSKGGAISFADLIQYAAILHEPTYG